MKFLHLEDNAHDSDLIRDMLESEWPGCVVDLARGAKEYIAALEHEQHDLILSDYRVPGFTGVEALTLAHELRPNTPFIFVSGTVGEETAAHLVRAGASDYLLKDRLQRLPLAIQRALQDNRERRAHQQAEERLREQAELLALAHDAIIVTDAAQVITFWNRGAERIFGFPAREVVGQSLAVPLQSSGEAEFRKLLDRLSPAGEANGVLQLCNRRGDAITVELSVTVVRDVAQRPRSQLCIGTDITEKKRLEEQFFRAQRLESLGMLAAGIAHDLNNALAPTLMAGQLLRGRTKDPDDLRVLEIVEKSATRGAALVKQILAFAGGGSAAHTLVQVKHLLRDIVEMIGQTFPKSIEVVSEVPSDLWPVKGNPTQLHQILLNLCINARDAMPEGGTLTLRARNHRSATQSVPVGPHPVSGEFLEVEVRDTGSGIPPELMTRIWEPFFTTKGEGKGTGLGLSTVAGIVASHGGFATVDSKVGEGSVFRVFLPAVVDREAEGGNSQHPFLPRGNGELIFVVDDDANVRESIVALLTQQGYRVMTMTDGIEALAQYAVRAQEVSLIVTDIDMPHLDGRALGGAIRRVNPAARILFISGTASPQTAERIVSALGATLLPKPFTPEALLTTVHRLLSSR